MSKMFQVYGIGQALIHVLPPPVGFLNPPTSNQTLYEIGQIAYTPIHNPTAFFIYGGGGTWVELATSAGDVLSIAGTANQIAASSPTGNVVLSLVGPYTPATYTAHGVLIGEGTGSIVASAVGTTGQVLTGNSAADPTFQAIGSGSGLTANGVLYGGGSSAFAATAAGTSGQILQSAGAASPPAYTTATYPATTTANQLLYSSATNTVGGLTSANTGTLITSSSGVPSIATLANGQVIIGQGASSSPAATFISNQQNTFVPKLTGLPIATSSAGAAAAVTINTYNIWGVTQWGAYFEQYNTTVSTNVLPVMSATAGFGWNINNIGAGNAKSIEITEGNTVNSKNAFVIGTSPAFFVKATFNVNTTASIAAVYVGFRKVQTYQATLPGGYTDYATIGAVGAASKVQLQTQVTSGGNTTTDTTNTITAGVTFTVEVDVSAGGVVTYKLNGVAPTTVAAYTFTNALTVVPYIIYTSAAGANAEVDLVSYQCGFQ